MTVIASVSSKDRYFTTLPLTIAAICAQTRVPDQFILWEDGEHKDLREISPYNHLLTLLSRKGIEWRVLYGQGKGQVTNHQHTLDLTTTTFVWRLDDDNVPAPNCLEELLKAAADPSVGAVAGLVLDPSAIGPRPSFITGKIEEIFSPFNLQWHEWSGVEDVDHLYSTFLYRTEAGRKAGGYSRELSPVGHREETMFSHSIKRAGYRLLVTTAARTWHFRESSGGIRSYRDPSLWDRDDQLFRRKLAEWGVTPREYLFIVLDNGIGDHFMLKGVLPKILERHPGKRVIIANCYPEVFRDVPGVEMASIADAKAALGDLTRFDAYRYAEAHGWKRPFPEVFLEIYR